MFKINIEPIPEEEEESVVIRCHSIDDEVISLMNRLKESKSNNIVGLKDEKIYQLKFKEIFYIEATDNITTIYCENDSYESKMKLFELEKAVPNNVFFRSSKSILLNYTKISCVSPDFNGRFNARLTNGDKMVISRQYVPELKKLLGL